MKYHWHCRAPLGCREPLTKLGEVDNTGLAQMVLAWKKRKKSSALCRFTTLTNDYY